MSKRLFINNVRSAYNVGSLFRTADGAGVERIYIGGYSPAPIDRFGRVQSEIAKTSLGANETVPWESVPMNGELHCLKKLKAEGFSVVALEQTSESLSLYQFAVPERVVYVVGNEVSGVDKAILECADVVVEIPMAGEKESLNVATAAGILLFHRSP